MIPGLALTAAHDVIHLHTCPTVTGRETVAWAVDRTVEQVRADAVEAGLSYCPTCKPLDQAVAA